MALIFFLQLWLLVSVTSAKYDTNWFQGQKGESCSNACLAAGRHCTPHSETAMKMAATSKEALLDALGFKFKKFCPDGYVHASYIHSRVAEDEVPLQLSFGMCTTGVPGVSDPTCQAASPSNTRICYCEPHYDPPSTWVSGNFGESCSKVCTDQGYRCTLSSEAHMKKAAESTQALKAALRENFATACPGEVGTMARNVVPCRLQLGLCATGVGHYDPKCLAGDTAFARICSCETTQLVPFYVWKPTTTTENYALVAAANKLAKEASADIKHKKKPFEMPGILDKTTEPPGVFVPAHPPTTTTTLKLTTLKPTTSTTTTSITTVTTTTSTSTTSTSTTSTSTTTPGTTTTLPESANWFQHHAGISCNMVCSSYQRQCTSESEAKMKAAAASASALQHALGSKFKEFCPRGVVGRMPINAVPMLLPHLRKCAIGTGPYDPDCSGFADPGSSRICYCERGVANKAIIDGAITKKTMALEHIATAGPLILVLFGFAAVGVGVRLASYAATRPWRLLEMFHLDAFSGAASTSPHQVELAAPCMTSPCVEACADYASESRVYESLVQIEEVEPLVASIP